MVQNRHGKSKSAAVALVLSLGAASLLAHAGETAAVPPDAVLADEPLFSTTSRVKPNMVLDLSVEFPTTGAAYRSEFDITKSYIGYWDPMGCYDYTVADGYFKRTASATVSAGAIVCAQKWSGNMLNWAASSAIDMLRYAMTGGDRVVDTLDQTVLQRAVLQDNFYNAGYNFPARVLRGNLDKLTPLSATLGAAGTVRIANCRQMLFVGSTSTGSCAKPGTDQVHGPGGPGAYFARVQVCSAAEGPLRRDLCVKQSSGRFKPVGTIQTYAEKMRFAAFGYLMDNTNARYGGVLRAPMKFAGPHAENAKFERVVNEAAEWDARTGVFVVNPLASTEGLSGVVNYLNQFGRTGPSPGTYKSLDTIGELYYESLRYLQGQPPSEQATAGMTEAMKDGFPVYNKSAGWGAGLQKAWDPVVASCQRNYVVAIGDLNTHHEHSLPGLPNDGLDGWPSGVRAVDLSKLEPDTAYWSRLVGGFENAEALRYTVPSRKEPLTMRGNASGPRAYAYNNGSQITSSNIATLHTGSDQGSLGWAGLAYWANTQKIGEDYPDVRVKTYTVDVDEGGDGTIRQGKRGSAYYLAAKYGGFDDKNKDGNPFVTSASTGDAEVIANAEWQSGVDDDGLPKPANYFLASKPEEMIAAIRQIFAKAGAASGTIAGGALSSTRVAASGTSVYIPQLDSTRWSGSLEAYPLSYDPKVGAVTKADRPTWSAGSLLTTHKRPDDRKIFTQSSSRSGAAFSWKGLSNDKRWADALNTQPFGQDDAKDGLGEKRVAYLRGGRTEESDKAGGVFRVRDSVMGDVVNSTPLLVGAPSSAVQGAGYDAFVASNKSRRHTVYVGANDGMLHAFAADTGEELFAYVPSSLSTALSSYTSPDYVHRPYVDGSPAADEVQLSNGAWRTALVSGMGGGARGIFALDVTRPSDFRAENVLWEFTGDDDADMGHVTQAPRILKFRTVAAKGSAPAVYRWFAVVPSGFNNQNSKKAAALFLVAMDKPPGEPWQRGVNYQKIVLPKPADTTLVNALGPVGDYAGADRSTRLLYAGDTQGNLWKFDFAGDAPWKEGGSVLGLSSPPMMVAQDAGGQRQPITIAPEVGAGPNGGAVVLFGTGKFVEVSDLSTRRAQTIYGFYDDGSAIPAGQARVQLQARTVTANGAGKFTITGDAFAHAAYNSKTSQRRGWYFDLPDAVDSGERQVSQMVLSDGYLLFNTLVPNPNACGVGGGGHSCAVNAMTGLSSGGTCIPSTVGLLSAPLIVQEGDGAFTSTDAFGRRQETKKVAVINLGTGAGQGPGVTIARPIEGGKVSRVAGRLNWRQVINYKDIKQ
ncbi:pilus assembly protein [Variovorax guangxiensis]|uniref:Pilus assembly protein PilY n=1 Tax=Variovorax guangxiensis TaxID=1775474 RepID=A0A502E2C1_9BURK|nr:PilC/PilY family type IV pilus protein [Variovorax guangxiensis]TPG26959.1 pilus assembly protein PilY [Variovorax ginsengisoli]TPG30686.1 pilus assembly protein PilY [Variovorax guangxiensis]